MKTKTRDRLKKILFKVVACALILTIPVALITGCEAIVAGVVAGGAVSVTIGWMWFLFDDDGNLDLSGTEIIKKVFTEIICKAPQMISDWLSKVVEKKEVKLGPFKVPYPKIHFNKIFKPITDALDPYRFASEYGAKLMSGMPEGLTEEEQRAYIKSHYNDEEIKNFLDNPDNPYLKAVETFTFFNSKGEEISEETALAQEEQNEKDREKLAELKKTLATINDRIFDLEIEIPIYEELAQKALQQYVASQSINDLILASIASAEVSSRKAELEKLQSTDTEALKEEIAELEKEIEKNEISCDVEVQYVQNPDYQRPEMYDEDAIQMGIQFLKEIMAS